jgi:hypothetical protein
MLKVGGRRRKKYGKRRGREKEKERKGAARGEEIV